MAEAPIPNLDVELRQDEGCISVPRKDTVGRWFCGVGCDLKAHGLLRPDGRPLSMDAWREDQIKNNLASDMVYASMCVAKYLPWSIPLDPVRARVLVNMMFNMGWGDGTHGLSSFTHTLQAVREGRWKDAADGMMASKWARQVGDRARRLAYRMETGLYHVPDTYRRAT